MISYKSIKKVSNKIKQEFKIRWKLRVVIIAGFLVILTSESKENSKTLRMQSTHAVLSLNKENN